MKTIKSKIKQMWIKIRRTFWAGVKNFIRNSWLSVATVSVIAIALFMVNTQMAIIGANHLRLEDVQQRVNISVYLKEDIPESRIEKFKNEVERYPEVKEVSIIGKDEALKRFKDLNSENTVVQRALDEFGGNPLPDTLAIKAHDTADYERIAKQLENSEFYENVSSVNYAKYRQIIDGLSAEIRSTQEFAIVRGVTLAIIAILVTFNSIRISMYSHKQEIEIMKLVGASNNYVRMPFVWEGVFYGIAAALVSIPLSYGYLYFISKGVASDSVISFSDTIFIKQFLSVYFMRYIFIVIFAQFIFGAALGVVSSLIAMRKYLKELQ